MIEVETEYQIEAEDKRKIIANVEATSAVEAITKFQQMYRDGDPAHWADDIVEREIVFIVIEPRKD